MEDLIWVRENLKTFKPKDFYKKMKYSHISREKAEQRLRELLNLIESESSKVNRMKASYLIDNFEVNKSITTSCRRRYPFTHLFVSSSIFLLFDSLGCRQLTANRIGLTWKLLSAGYNMFSFFVE